MRHVAAHQILQIAVRPFLGAADEAGVAFSHLADRKVLQTRELSLRSDKIRFFQQGMVSRPDWQGRHFLNKTAIPEQKVFGDLGQW